MSEEYPSKQIRYTKSGKRAKNKESNTYKGLVQPRYHVTAQEYAIIQRRAIEAGLSLNEYTRRRLLGHPVYSAEAFHALGLLQAVHSQLWGTKSEDRTLKYQLLKEVEAAIKEGRQYLGTMMKEDGETHDHHDKDQAKE